MGRDRNRVIDLNRAREMILGLMAENRARFSVSVCEMHREEYVDIKVECEICGVQLARDGGMLKMIVGLNSIQPPGIIPGKSALRDAVMQSVPATFPFLVKDTYQISFDAESVRAVNRERELKQFRDELEYAVQAHGFTLDQALPVMMAFISDNLNESSYGNLEELLKTGSKPTLPDRTVLEITPPGVPCPHCTGLLSEESIRELMKKYYIRYKSDMYDY